MNSSDDFTVDDSVKSAGHPSYIGGTAITSTPTHIDTGAAQREESGGGGLTEGNLNLAIAAVENAKRQASGNAGSSGIANLANHRHQLLHRVSQ